MDLIELFKLDNMRYNSDRLANLIYADMIYENTDMSWIYKYWDYLANNGVFIVQTDYHTAARVKIILDNLYNSVFINEVIYKQEWGGVPKKGFPIKHDNIYIYSNGDDWKWYGDRIQIPKKTAGTAFDKKGTGKKTPCSVFDDLGNFSTMDKERIKNADGKNQQWQKPLKLMRRLMLPFLDAGDLVIDPFMGVGSSGVVAKEIGCYYIGIENDPEVFELARKNLYE